MLEILLNVAEICGAIKSPFDSRDYVISSAMDISGVDIPADFEVWQPPVEDQGSTGNCVAQSLANIMECIAYNESLEEYLISIGVNFLALSPEEYIKLLNDVQGVIDTPKDYSVGYIYGSENNSAPSGGMISREACSILLHEGDVLRSTWECFDENPKCKNKRSMVYDKIKSQAKKIHSYVRLYTKEEVQSFMLKYKLPVLISAPTSAYKGGGKTGYHATACYGWESEESFVKRTGSRSNYKDMLYTNSWGNYFIDPDGRDNIAFKDILEIWGIVPMEKITLSDIDGRWSKSAIEREIERGNIKGYEDGSFKPTQQITREEVAVMFDRSHTAEEKKFAELLKRIEQLEKRI